MHPNVISPEQRRDRLGQGGLVLWFTGLSGSGKSTIAMALEKALVERKFFCTVLDGDNVRQGLCGDLGFGAADRMENLRRVAEVARLMCDASLLTLCAFVSPTRAARAMARDIVGPPKFIEVHVATPLAVCEARDPKGLYRKARLGEIAQFTGVSAPYEPPLEADIVVQPGAQSVETIVEELIVYLETRIARREE